MYNGSIVIFRGWYFHRVLLSGTPKTPGFPQALNKEAKIIAQSDVYLSNEICLKT